MSSHEAHKAGPASSSPRCPLKARKQATADKLKFNLLVDANNEVGKAFGVVYTFPRT
jgi:peroxiredoxin